MIYKAEIRRVLTQIIELDVRTAKEAIEMAETACSQLPEEDFNAECAVVSLVSVGEHKEEQLTLNFGGVE